MRGVEDTLGARVCYLLNSLRQIEKKLSASVNIPTPVAMPVVAATAVGPAAAGHGRKVSPPVNEKRERDEQWKQYLTRCVSAAVLNGMMSYVMSIEQQNQPQYDRCHV